MKKELFNDKYGLTSAVLNRIKTNTRRLIKGDYEKITAYHVLHSLCFIAETKDGRPVEIKPRYQIGDEVAVAMSYESIIEAAKSEDKIKHFLVKKDLMLEDGRVCVDLFTSSGWTNKMFVRADLMPHRIRITDIKAERLQDISDEDCLREGILQSVDGMDLYTFDGWVKRSKGHVLPVQIYTKNRREAFAALIDRVCGRGTWERNPWVFAYEFELIKK